MSEQTKTAVKQGGMNTKVRYITVTAMLSAVAFVLMYLEIAIPIMPSFIKFDFSDLPALLGSFALGPVCGVLICHFQTVCLLENFPILFSEPCLWQLQVISTNIKRPKRVR